MSDNKSQGGAGTSLGTHSKDSPHGAGQGSGAGAASQAAGQHGGSSAGPGTRDRLGDSQSGSWQQTGADMASQAKEGMERMASNVRDAAASARDTIAQRGSQAMESTGQMVRDQPLMALAVTGIACFAIGMMIGRGRY